MISTDCQTDPVRDDYFDWDLSDKADCETQTPAVVATAAAAGGDASFSSPFFSIDSLPQDAIVQTDQRLVFFLRRESAQAKRAAAAAAAVAAASGSQASTKSRADVGAPLSPPPPIKAPSPAVDAWVQTYVEVQEASCSKRH